MAYEHETRELKAEVADLRAKLHAAEERAMEHAKTADQARKRMMEADHERDRFREALEELYVGAAEVLGAPEPDKGAAQKRLSLLLDKYEDLAHKALTSSEAE